MTGFDRNNIYKSIKIPDRRSHKVDEAEQMSLFTDKHTLDLKGKADFYEIEYGDTDMPGVGKFVRKSEKITKPEIDPVRQIFYEMRDIGRKYASFSRRGPGHFNRLEHQMKAKGFYEQAVFMKDFEDDYDNLVEFEAYFPSYQTMGYDQLRTYFTWRTWVRDGHITGTSLSYVFLYIYELLANVGPASPQEGLEELVTFWQAYSPYDHSIDPYIIRWLKDYHIYYDLAHSFQSFVEDHQLNKYYPKTGLSESPFKRYSKFSSYAIEKSAFYKEDTEDLISRAFEEVMAKLTNLSKAMDLDLEGALFRGASSKNNWEPFKGAVFHPRMRPDTRVMFSDTELYECMAGRWVSTKVVPRDGTRHLLGFIMKQTEASLRELLGYKRKLSPSSKGVNHVLKSMLEEEGTSLETFVTETVKAFYREETKIVIEVDHSNLSLIRKEALATQEKLIVEEALIDEPVPILNPEPEGVAMNPEPSPPVTSPVYEDPWQDLRAALTDIELGAIQQVLTGDFDLKTFADHHGIMLELLLDGINEKAFDAIGDNLLDEDCSLYEDYIDDMKEMVNGL